MENVVMKKLIDRAFEAADRETVLTFAFQGGEPLLAGLPYFRSFVAYVERKRTGQEVRYSIQTNGTLLTDEWGEFFARQKFLVGLSLDGYESNTNTFRIDQTGKGVYKRIMDGLGVLKRHQVEYNILAVITRKLSGHGKAFYSFLRQNQVSHVQCIPCLGGLEDSYEQEMKPEHYVKFYKDLYWSWLCDVKGGGGMSISLFDQLFLMLMDRPPIQCGMLGFCSPQMVVEADGSVYPCDFYVLDEYYCGNICEHSIWEIAEHENMKRFLEERSQTTKICEDCPFSCICHGGCKRQNRAYLKEDGCAHREFLSWAYPSMAELLSSNMI